jgi:hypothetical protein
MTTRIVAIGAKDQIKIEDDGPNRKKATFPKGATYNDNQIKTETADGVGAAIAGGGVAGANQLRTGNNGATPFNITDIQGIVFKLPLHVAGLLSSYIAFKDKIKEAKGDATELKIVLTKLKYNGAATATGDDTSEGRFELDGNNLVINENSFADQIAG